jgi:hypothetical protein
MATYTTNLSLIKPAGTDKIRIAQINQNMDTIDAAIGAVGNTSLQTQVTSVSDSMSAVEGGIAIVSNNNSHVAITSGQYVYVKNHATLSEGLYRATQAIATNGTLTLSNVTPESAGGLNSLNEQIGTVSDKIPRLITTQHNNTNAYNAGSNGWEEFTFQSSQWPDGYQFCAFSSGGAGNGLLVLCKIDVDNANKTVKLLLRNDTSNNVAAGVTGVQCNVLIMKQ